MPEQEITEGEFQFRCTCKREWKGLWPLPIVLGSLVKRLMAESCPECGKRDKIFLVVREETDEKG